MYTVWSKGEVKMNSLIDNIIKSVKKLLTKVDTKSSNKKKYNWGNVIILVLLGAVLIITSNIFSKKSANTSLPVNKDCDVNVVTGQNNSSNGSPKSVESMSNYGEELNSKLVSILSSIKGVGKVKSMIYFEGGEEYIPAINENNSISTTEETDTSGGKRKIDQNDEGKSIVTFSDNNSSTKPLITQTKAPKITGLCVVAEGAEDIVTELRITQAVVNLFEIAENKVHVYPMK